MKHKKRDKNINVEEKGEVKNEIGDKGEESGEGAQIEELTKTKSVHTLTDPFQFTFITYSTMYEGIGSVPWGLTRARGNLEKLTETLKFQTEMTGRCRQQFTLAESD
jgi:hypothetical protein